MQNACLEDSRSSVRRKDPIKVLWEPISNCEGGDQLRRVFEIIFDEESLSLDVPTFDENDSARQYEGGAGEGSGPTKGRSKKCKIDVRN